MRREPLLLSLAVVLTALSSVPATGSEAAVPPDESVEGHSQSDWSRLWWQWASSFPNKTTPVADRTGLRCGAGQSGRVWFLAGGFGSARVQRACTVPRDKYLFFPLVNYVFFPNRDNSSTCERAQERARQMTDSPSILVAEIDGVQIPDLIRHRQATLACFDLAARADVRISIAPSAANGYYLMLSPLAPGRHTLRFGGEVAALRQAISYELTVE